MSSLRQTNPPYINSTELQSQMPINAAPQIDLEEYIQEEVDPTEQEYLLYIQENMEEFIDNDPLNKTIHFTAQQGNSIF